MSNPKATGPVVVTFRQVEQALTKQEAVQQIHDAAQADKDASPAERAAGAATIGNVLNT
ncbi:hypothetical protein BH10PLA2_BH10PLA2_14210 [soil metagenome]